MQITRRERDRAKQLLHSDSKDIVSLSDEEANMLHTIVSAHDRRKAC